MFTAYSLTIDDDLFIEQDEWIEEQETLLTIAAADEDHPSLTLAERNPSLQ